VAPGDIARVRRKGLTIVQVGDPVLRQRARALTGEEIRSRQIRQLIEKMRQTMFDAPGVGLAAPQIGLSLQIAVIEDREEYLEEIPAENLAERERRPIPFQVLINPAILSEDRAVKEDRTAKHDSRAARHDQTTGEAGGESVTFYEGCLSLAGFTALVPRARRVRVSCLDEHGRRKTIDASGWYARILQHEIDHLYGRLYIDRMDSRTFASLDNFDQFSKGKPIEEILTALDGKPDKKA
jgi:peptide deformylase